MKHFISSLFLLLLGFQFNAQAQCSASFTTSNGTLGNNLLHVTLNNTSTYTTPINNYFYTTSIDFGDGNSQTYNGSYGTTHNYSSPGTYLITLTIQVIDTFPNSVMCTDTETGSITIDYAPCSSTATVVDNGNSSYTFTATNPAQTPGIVHTWNFGDGTTATGSTVTHTYTTGANYNVILTSTASGCTSTNNNIYLNVIPNCNQLSAEFAKFQQGLQTNFYNTSTIANYYDFTLHADWYFGDGNSALNINQPVHTYTNPGIYTVMMVNKWMDTVPGQAPSILYCQDTSIQTITVYDNFISGIVSALMEQKCG
jgi:PKD repeat protein